MRKFKVGDIVQVNCACDFCVAKGYYQAWGVVLDILSAEPLAEPDRCRIDVAFTGYNADHEIFLYNQLILVTPVTETSDVPVS